MTLTAGKSHSHSFSDKWKDSNSQDQKWCRTETLIKCPMQFDYPCSHMCPWSHTGAGQHLVVTGSCPAGACRPGVGPRDAAGGNCQAGHADSSGAGQLPVGSSKAGARARWVWAKIPTEISDLGQLEMLCICHAADRCAFANTCGLTAAQQSILQLRTRTTAKGSHLQLLHGMCHRRCLAGCRDP
jgi:hypothetical protein